MTPGERGACSEPLTRPPPPIPVPEPFAVTRDITDRLPSLDCESPSRMVVYSFRGCVRLPRRVTHPAGSGTEDDLQRRGRRLRAPALQRWRLLKRLSDTRVERSSAPVYCVPAWAATAARSEGGSGLVDAAICVITFLIVVFERKWLILQKTRLVVGSIESYGK